MWGQMGKVYKTAVRHTAGIQQYGTLPLWEDVISNGVSAGSYGVLLNLLAFSMALSTDLRYSMFSFVAALLQTSLRCLS